MDGLYRKKKKTMDGLDSKMFLQPQQGPAQILWVFFPTIKMLSLGYLLFFKGKKNYWILNF